MPTSPGPTNPTVGEGATAGKVAVIVPAYNEEKTIGLVIDAARSTDTVLEVVVVSDGSSDRTVEVAKAHGAEVVVLEENRGKTAAMRAGLLRTQASFVLFLDGDLLGLRPEHVRSLVDPVLRGEADITVGVMRHGRTATDLAQAMAPFLSGMRAGKVEVFQTLHDLDEKAGWGAEVALTLWAKENKRRIVEVQIDGVSQRMKEEKVGFAKGFMSRLRMYWDILRVVPKSERVRR